MADAFLHLPAEDRRGALGVAADRSGRPEHLAGTGHATHRKEAQAFNRLLAQFLETIT